MVRDPTPIKQKKAKKKIKKPFIKELKRKQNADFLCYFGKRFISKKTQKTQDIQSQFESIELVDVIEDIITGDSHLILKNIKEQFLTYGDNQFGQICPKEITSITQPSKMQIHSQIKITKIFSGYDHCFAIDQNNDVYSWGLNCKGQLGIGTYENSYTPVRVKQLSQQTNKNNYLTPGYFSSSILKPQESIIEIACGALHTIALSNKNRVYSCGFGQSFALGHGNNQTLDLFKEIKFFSDIQNNQITKIAAGVTHSGCLVSGTLYVWGSQGTTKHLIHSKPNQVVLDYDAINFEMGDCLTVILTQNRDVYTLGTNIDFQLGYQGVQSSTPQKVNIGKKVTSINCGLNHVIVAVSNNIYGWGSNRYGQINPFSQEKFFDCLIEIDWAKQAFVKIIKCCPLSTVFISRYPIKDQSDDHEKNIEEVEKQIFNLERQIDQLQNQNQKMETQFDDLYTTLQSMSIDNDLTSTEMTQTNADQKIAKLMGQLERERVFYQNYEIDFNEIIFDKKISHGAFGEIYKATWREHKVAVKTLKQQHRSENPIKDFLSECQALISLRHPNIVMCHGCCTKTPQTLAIILEYCPNDSLWNLLRNKKGQLSWKKKINIALGVAKGMNYLHCFPIPIVHRDLKSLNVLIDAYHNPKITDFGWSRFVAEKMTGKVGTYQWMAPEVIKTKKYTEKADVFSFGIILWELASEEPPYKNKQQAAVSLEVVNNDLRPEIPDNCPKQVSKLMKKCWSKDQYKRPSFEMIIKELLNIKSSILE